MIEIHGDGGIAKSYVTCWGADQLVAAEESMTPEERLVMYQLMREYVDSQWDAATDPENWPLTLRAKEILGDTTDVEDLERFRKFREELSRLEERHGFKIQWDGTYTQTGTDPLGDTRSCVRGSPGIGKTVFVPELPPEQPPQLAPQTSDDDPF
jgi:hypothetical protein